MNPMSDKGYKDTEGALGYGDVHCDRSEPGKFDFGFMEAETKETAMAKPKQPAGVFPIAEGKESAFAKPVHAPNTYA